MQVKYCILSGAELITGNDSRAHIIPSALGGKLKPKGLVSHEANGMLNTKFDLPLVRAYQPLMSLLGGARDRGENQPIQMTDTTTGQTYEVVFGKPLGLSKPEYTEEQTPKGTRISIKARTMAEAKTLLGRIKKQFPDADLDNLLREASMQHAYPDGMLHATLQIGPRVTFPAAFVMASLFAAFNGLPTHSRLQEYATGFNLKSPTLPVDTFYWVQPQSWFTTGTELAHILVLRGNARRQQALFYVELFNALGIAVLLPYDHPQDSYFFYGVDVINGNEITVNIDTQRLDALGWQSTHEVGDPALNKIVEQQIGRIIGIAQSRARNRHLSQLIGEVLGPADGSVITEEKINELARRIADFAARQMRGYKPDKFK